MPEILLSKGCVAIVDEIDVDLLQFKWHVSFSPSSHYAVRVDYSAGKQSPKKQFLHRVIVERIVQCPLTKDEVVDHINGDSLLNTRQNLRIVSNAQNQWNSKRPSHNTSGFKGVSFNRRDRVWVAYIHVGKRHIHLGSFKTPEAAYQAYCEAARTYFGDFARFE